jgi:hypothetical protein
MISDMVKVELDRLEDLRVRAKKTDQRAFDRRWRAVERHPWRIVWWRCEGARRDVYAFVGEAAQLFRW